MNIINAFLAILLWVVAGPVAAAITLSANGDANGPVTINEGDSVTFEVTATNCQNVGGNNSVWRDIWVNAGNPTEQIFGSSPCSVGSFGRTVTYNTAGTYTVTFISEFCRNYRNGSCRTGWREDQRDSIVVNVVAFTCFEDDYASGSLNPDDWVARSASGSFTPSAVNGRMRMTEASGNQSTAVTLQREIPGADNLVVLEFDYYAYGGSGADGIAVVLSDATITPQPGSFGGSLGYAQRNNGDDGFAGGWLGVGIDEYGNFSASTEGRQGGPGRILDSVSIRGSGSGGSGYNYLQGTGQLSPGIDSTGSSNPHRYRITVDSRTSGQAIVSVERDTGSGFQELIAPFDVLNDPNQAAVPENFLLSLTGSTGGATNIHELDDLELCALQLNPVGDQIDHFEIVHDGVALTCQPETVTIRACDNADCSQLYTDPVEATLSPSTGWQGGNTISFSGGTGQATLQNTTAGDVTLDVVGSEPPTKPQATTLCEESGGAPSSADCVLTFVDSGLAFDVPDLISHKPVQSIEVRAVRRNPQTEACVPAFENVDRTVQFWSTYVDPGPSGRPVSRPVSVDGTDVSVDSSAPTTLTLSFGAGGIAEIEVAYPDAGQMQLDALYEGSIANQDDGLVMPGADIFASRPAGLCVSTTGACAAADSSCPVFVKAGAAFDLSITAAGWDSDTDTDLCTGNPTTPNFEMTGIALSQTLVAPAGGDAGEFAPAEYDHSRSASATTVVSATENEVGVFEFVASPGTANYFGMTIPVSTSAPAGRFYPDRFVASVQAGAFQAACTTGSAFSYIGQPFTWSVVPSLRLEARSVGSPGTITENYTEVGFQKLTAAGVSRASPIADSTALDANNDPLSATVNTAAGSLTSVAPGLLEYVYAPSDTAEYDKSVDAKIAPVSNPELEFTVDSVVDADGVSASTPILFTPDMLFDVRYGRLEMENVYGPENLPAGSVLEMPFYTQYWDGSRFVLNTDDGCTNWTTADITDTENHHSLETASGTVSGGEGGPLQLDPDGTEGTDTLTWAVEAWLQDDSDEDGSLDEPSALATFGVYRGNDRVIYWEER
ncbi:DUF6701 domain-containing protein [Marinobacter sp. CHS3-4]|uniref:DUF6701 domain-containing protein n=1 Tax=Marinobacter sp. CHS3-4 TaxID=3045174 RepID=UPI0024B618E9|nr:DUF6701 domain-containing protein [Marinobacter sp. CHS3-4]MDI9246680.1 MshQ-like protein [Marinobacter sp. CHS3-4]